MSVSDAQFQVWAETSGKRRCSLFELTFLGLGAGSPTAGSEMRAYVSDKPYVAVGAFGVTIKAFDPRVVGLPSFTRRMNEALVGRSSQSYGDLLVANNDGELDDWLSMNWDGRRVRQWIGDPDWDFADFRLVLSGVIVDVFDAGDGRIGFHLSDKSALLDRPIMVDVLGGTGPRSGDLMPLCLGYYNVNLSPLLIDEVDHIYRFTQADVAAGEIPYTSNVSPENPYNVREDGVSMRSSGYVTGSDAVADTIEKVAHGWVLGTRLCFRPYGGSGQEPPTPLAYSTTAIDQTYYWVAEIVDADNVKLADTFAGGLAGTPNIDITQTLSGKSIPYDAMNWTPAGDGTFQLASNPAGLITCDCYGIMRTEGSPPALAYRWTAGDLINQVLTSGITNTPFSSADIDSTSLSDFVALCPQAISIYITEQTTFAELLDKLVISVGGWWGFSRAGLLQFGRLALPVGASPPTYSFVEDDLALRSLKMQRRILPRVEVKLIGVQNWTVQDYIAASVDEYSRNFYRSPNEVVTGTATVVGWSDDPTNHIRAARPEPYQTYMSIGSSVLTEAQRLATMLQYPTAVFAFQTHQVVFLLNLGYEIYLESGKYTGYGVLVGIVENPEGQSTLEFFCQIRDVYPTEDIA